MKFFDTPIGHEQRLATLHTERVMIRSRANYFAYSSNMLTARLRERVPSASAIGIGQLVGHALSWDKHSWQDGSGKCDAEATSGNDDVVWGVLFELDPEDKPALDKAEGVGAGYLEKTVNVLTEAGPVTAVTYCATDKDAALRPYHWYKALVIAGAREHGLPASYRNRLELVATVSEHTTRARRHRELLPG
jgi:gamma-glutamylcyclotransferase